MSDLYGITYDNLISSFPVQLLSDKKMTTRKSMKQESVNEVPFISDYGITYDNIMSMFPVPVYYDKNITTVEVGDTIVLTDVVYKFSVEDDTIEFIDNGDEFVDGTTLVLA